MPACVSLLRNCLLLAVAVLILSSCGQPGKKPVQDRQAAFEEDWESLAAANEEPDWLKDAKFGIYFHWGVYSVPAYSNEWYPRMMHFKGLGVYEHHLEHYGHPSEFGYHDFVPLFRAAHFDPDAWPIYF